jgi:hypothetical protein
MCYSRIYTYKITFEEVPYYYYGSKKERYFNEYYMGSPYTHKWCWDFYTAKKQILELFDYTDEGYIECRKVENRLIRPILNNPWCLNSHCGGNYSLEICSKNGKKGSETQRELEIGIYALTTKQRQENGRKGNKEGKQLSGIKMGNLAYKNKIGIHSFTSEQHSQNGIKGGTKSKELGVGMFSISEERKSKISSGNATKVNSQRWMCLETEYVTNPGALSKYQKARGIDTSERVRIS